jgi:hypothetical protein
LSDGLNTDPWLLGQAEGHPLCMVDFVQVRDECAVPLVESGIYHTDAFDSIAKYNFTKTTLVLTAIETSQLRLECHSALHSGSSIPSVDRMRLRCKCEWTIS